jgi:hypothetical protein
MTVKSLHVTGVLWALIPAVLIGGPSLAKSAAGGHPLKATLTGAAEKPKAADPDGKGAATVRVDVAKSQVCYDVQVSGIGPATMAHIHKGSPTEAGPVAIPLKAPGPDGKSSDCTQADQALLKDILQNPGRYYVNVHNAEFPAGAIRGQLSK